MMRVEWRNSNAGLLPWYQREEKKIIHSLEWRSNPQPSHYSHTLVPLRHDDLMKVQNYRLYTNKRFIKVNC